MKNKKLLSLLCLVALVGCGTTSTSSTNNQPSSPASSSTVAPSSSVSTSSQEVSSSTVASSSSSSTVDSSSTVVDSSSNNSSSTPEESTPVVTPDTANDIILDLKEKVNASIDSEKYGAVTEMTYSQYSTATTTSTKNHNKYYTDAVVTTSKRGYSSTTTYKKVLDNRYYEVELDTYDEENPEVNSIVGYEIVDENADNSQLTKEEVNSKLAFSAGTVDGFGYGLTLESLVNCIFEEYDSESCYNISISKKYVSSNDYEGVVNAISFFYEQVTPDMGNKLYYYSAEFGFEADGSLDKLLLCQKTYDANSYDFDTHSLNISGTPTGSYFYDYGFEFGVVTEEEAALFDISANLFTDFEVKFYSNSGKTNEITEAQKGSAVYIKATGTPAEASDKVVLVSCTDDSLSSYFGKPVDNIYSYYPETTGEVKFVFASAAGITKTITLNVTAVEPTSIDARGEIPSILAVNASVELPSCSVQPYAADQEYEWKITDGANNATISEENGVYTLTGTASGTVKVQANVLNYSDIKTQEFSIEIVEAKTETELKTIMTTTEWVYNDYGIIYSLTLSEDGKGSINFGKEVTGRDANGPVFATVDTLYNFDYEFDYTSGVTTVSNGEWVNRQENGNFSQFKNPTIEILLTGDGINVTFSYDWYEMIYETEYNFTPACTPEDLKVKVVKTWSADVELGNYNNAYFYLTFNDDNTGSIYLEGIDENYNEIEISYTEFTYSWNENNQIVISTLENVVFEHNAEIYDYETDTSTPVTYSISFGNIIDVEPLFCYSLSLSYNVTDTTNATSSGIATFSESY